MQEIKLLACMRGEQGGYSAISNNCGTPIQNCLKKLGFDTDSPLLPMSLGNKLIDIGASHDGSSQHPATSPSNGWNAPWAR